MKLKAKRLNKEQLKELAKVCLDIGKAIFLGSVAAYVLPPLAEKEVSIIVFAIGLIGSLTFVIIGLILLREEK